MGNSVNLTNRRNPMEYILGFALLVNQLTMLVIALKR